jgi:hypothetical protein
VQLAPGHSDDAPPGGLEPPVASAVLLEGVLRVVGRAAVELDDDALIEPHAVHLDAFDKDVGERFRKTGIEEGLEALFELAPDYAQAELCFFKDSSEDGDPRLAWVALDQGLYPERIGQPELLGLPEGAAQLVSLNESTEVKMRARDGRDRYAVMDGDLVGGEVGVVELDARPRLSTARHRDLDPASPADGPQRRGGEMAEHGAGATREDGGHPVRAPCHETSTNDRVHAPVNLAEPAFAHPVADRAASNIKL